MALPIILNRDKSTRYSCDKLLDYIVINRNDLSFDKSQGTAMNRNDLSFDKSEGTAMNRNDLSFDESEGTAMNRGATDGRNRGIRGII